MTSKEVLELLKNLTPSKSPGPDQIRPSELKMVAKESAWSVSILFNEILVTDELPPEFKMGNIAPLLKPGKTNTALPSTYYRGITVAIDDWLLAQDSKMHTAIVFIDLSKAFDNVQHQLLLLKRQEHGIGGSALAWFWSNLSQCSQNGMLNGSSSEYFYSSKGVPQGSVLGPLLFNIYVAGLPSIAVQQNASITAIICR